MKQLTKELENHKISCKNQFFVKKKKKIKKYLKYKKYRKIRDHCHYTGEYKSANLKYFVSKKNPVVFHNG